jgi:hypothetical protein
MKYLHCSGLCLDGLASFVSVFLMVLILMSIIVLGLSYLSDEKIIDSLKAENRKLKGKLIASEWEIKSLKFKLAIHKGDDANV